MKMLPVEYASFVFGSNKALAKAIGRDPSCISRWKATRKRGGCNGRIPGTLHKTILLYAIKHKMDLTALDLVMGREVRVAAQTVSK